MDNELRDLLQRKADEVDVTTRAPKRVLQRARRRRAGTVALSGLLTVGLVAAGFAGAQALLNGNHRTITSATTPPPSGAVAACSAGDMQVSLASQEGAAGTIRTVWQAKNVSGSPCQSSGYPEMDFHASTGWLGVTVIHGGYPDIDVAPQDVTVPADVTLSFVSYWSDVDTAAGPCQQFDKVRITLPDGSGSAEVDASGCLTPTSVRVGPVTVPASD